MSQPMKVLSTTARAARGAPFQQSGCRVQASASGRFYGISVTSDGTVTYCEGAAQTDCDDGTSATQAWDSAW